MRIYAESKSRANFARHITKYSCSYTHTVWQSRGRMCGTTAAFVGNWLYCVMRERGDLGHENTEERRKIERGD